MVKINITGVFFILAVYWGQAQDINCDSIYASYLKKNNKNLLTTIYERPATVIGGIDSIKKHIKYPVKYKMQKVEGIVFVWVLIGKDSLIKCKKIIAGINGDFDNEALNVIHRIKYLPALYNNNSYDSDLLIPIRFQYSELKKKKIKN